MKRPVIADPPFEKLQELAALHGAAEFAAAYEKGQSLARRYPLSPALSNILGVLCIALSRTDDAVAHLRQALNLRPEFHAVRVNLGTLLREAGQFNEARAALQPGLDHAPSHVGLLSALASVEAEDGNGDLAINLMKNAIASDPKAAPSYEQLGRILSGLGKHAESVSLFRVAIQLKPDYAEAYLAMADALQVMDKLEEALSAYQNAVRLAPNSSPAHINLAAFHANTGNAEKAAEHYSKAVALEPENLTALASSLYYRAMLCIWDDARERDLQRLASAAFGPDPKRSPSPFVMMTLFDDPALQLRAAKTYMERVATKFGGGRPAPFPPAEDKIKLGYFSADFHNHATMHLIARLFETHDRSWFEVHAFSFASDDAEGIYRKRLRENIDFFHDVGGMGDGDIVALSRQLGIEIAVDLKGHTRDGRAGVFLRRAAPVQVNYLGYPGTCGDGAWDYIIADRVMVPAGQEIHYSEKCVYLPDSYQANDDTKQISERQFMRAECGLPDRGFVFCCFNSAYKITPEEFDIWMRLLKQVEGSALWLLATTPTTTENLKAAAALRGVDPSRLVFAERMPITDHLGRHRLADLFLDTFTVNAHTTASDALWAGLPVLTKAGKGFAARVSASLLHAVGLEELVTPDAAAYEQLALALAEDGQRLDAMKAHLRADPAALPLFNSEVYTRNLERAYAEMSRIRRAGEMVRPFVLT